MYYVMEVMSDGTSFNVSPNKKAMPLEVAIVIRKQFEDSSNTDYKYVLAQVVE